MMFVSLQKLSGNEVATKPHDEEFEEFFAEFENQGRA